VKFLHQFKGVVCYFVVFFSGFVEEFYVGLGEVFCFLGISGFAKAFKALESLAFTV
jgi:hypothetical protein